MTQPGLEDSYHVCCSSRVTDTLTACHFPSFLSLSRYTWFPPQRKQGLSAASRLSCSAGSLPHSSAQLFELPWVGSSFSPPHPPFHGDSCQPVCWGRFLTGAGHFRLDVWANTYHALDAEMATHSRILAWKISWTEEPGGLQSTGWQRVGHGWATNLLTYHAWALFPAHAESFEWIILFVTCNIRMRWILVTNPLYRRGNWGTRCPRTHSLPESRICVPNQQGSSA